MILLFAVPAFWICGRAPIELYLNIQAVNRSLAIESGNIVSPRLPKKAIAWLSWSKYYIPFLHGLLWCKPVESSIAIFTLAKAIMVYPASYVCWISIDPALAGFGIDSRGCIDSIWLVSYWISLDITFCYRVYLKAFLGIKKDENEICIDHPMSVQFCIHRFGSSHGYSN